MLGELLDAARGAELAGDQELRVTLPGGERVGSADAAKALSELLGRRVRLEPGSHHDFARIHFLTTRTLAHLRTLEPDTDWDPRRFRPNVVFDDGDRPGAFSEEGFGIRGVCAGVYAQVAAQGRLAVGERVRVAGL